MIIGLTGTIGSGKSSIALYLQNKGFQYITISDIIREEAIRKGIFIKRKELQDLGNQMRKLKGNNYWARQVLKKISQDENWIIDGIRNLGEVEELRELKNFILIGIDAPEELRLIRAKRRNSERVSSDPKDMEELKHLEARDRGIGEPDYGQQVLKCLQVADHTIINDKSLDELHSKINQLLQKYQG